MIHISTAMPDVTRRLPFYLALEEWVARRMPDGDYFFTWRVDPTVIIGRNQEARKEVNLDYCREHGIQLYRRRSGGGCVYADMDNLMLSYICPCADVQPTFTRFAAKVSDALKVLGLNADVTGRNDVTVDGLKVSGAAYYRLPGRSIVHSTLLFGTDPQNMLHAITPDRSKLESHKVASVVSRITTLGERLPNLTIEALQDHMIRSFTTETYTLTDSDMEAVRAIEEPYYDLHWIFGRSGVLGCPSSTVRLSRRLDGVGQINMLLTLIDGKIAETEMTGDFFMLADLDEAIFDRIKGVELKRGPLLEALGRGNVERAISGLTTQTFVDLLVSQRHQPQSPPAP